jgi:predicted nucleotidyltransferase/AraC-like DNA-binding protein
MDRAWAREVKKKLDALLEEERAVGYQRVDICSHIEYICSRYENTAREMTNIGKLLFGGSRGRILALLLLHPDESYHLREIARLAGISPGTLHRELRQLEEAGLLTRASRGNQVLYQADQRCPVYGELSALLKKTVGMADVLRDALTDLADSIQVAAVFGSVARGEERRGSDIDLLIIGDVDFTDLVVALHGAQKILGREINPVIHSRAGFLEAVAANDRFIRGVLDDPLIFVLGAADDLG